LLVDAHFELDRAFGDGVDACRGLGEALRELLSEIGALRVLFDRSEVAAGFVG
jgi:hypothetical protein